jgi:hypothetical protein
MTVAVELWPRIINCWPLQPLFCFNKYLFHWRIHPGLTSRSESGQNQLVNIPNKQFLTESHYCYSLEQLPGRQSHIDIQCRTHISWVMRQKHEVQGNCESSDVFWGGGQKLLSTSPNIRDFKSFEWCKRRYWSDIWTLPQYSVNS